MSISGFLEKIQTIMTPKKCVKFLGKFNQSPFVFKKDHMSPYLGNECLLEDF
jgi:hypothetical protein